MNIDIWSDVVCPWCYIGKRRFEAALADFAHRDEVRVRWRSFQLDPHAPPNRSESLVDHLATKYGVDHTEAQAMHDRVTAIAAHEGLEYRFDVARPGNTFNAHRVLHLAADRGCQDAVKERFLAGYFAQGRPIGEPDALADMASEAGLDAVDVKEVLATDAYAGAVRDDEALARRLGVTGVPFFMLDRAYGVSGAQPAPVLLQALERAWAERDPVPTR